VEVSDIPNAENVTSISVNMQDQVVEVTYKGYVSPYVPQTGIQWLDASPDAMVAKRYDGELDEPDHPVRRYIGVEQYIKSDGTVNLNDLPRD
jgi:hypothetical protein